MQREIWRNASLVLYTLPLSVKPTAFARLGWAELSWMQGMMSAHPSYSVHDFQSHYVSSGLYHHENGEIGAQSCEALEQVDRLGSVAYEHLLDSYLNRDAPLIVMDAMESWAVMNTDNFWFDNITQLYLQDEKLVDTVPCILTTNLRPGSSDLHAFLKRINSPKIDKWFVHWQNCDIHAVKALRKFYQRPYFLSSSVSPAHFNWVLMSSDYTTKIYKKVGPEPSLVEAGKETTSPDII
uniref:Uncharacterized protein n=1 Tax=Timema douglasi TaxID=61478 RepID=A0A7R8Z986_TIMDO|nr:unnamed protein product [Timema douglasi]